MNFKKTYTPAKGYTPVCKIGECSLKKLEFGLIELDGAESLDFYTDDKEFAFIMLEGHCDVTVNGETLKIRTEDDGSTFVYVDVVPETTVTVEGC